MRDLPGQPEPEHHQLLPCPCCRRGRSPGHTRRAQAYPPGDRQVSHFQQPAPPSSGTQLSHWHGGEATHRGRPQVTQADRRRELQHQTAALLQSRHVISAGPAGQRGDPKPGRRAGSGLRPLDRRGTPMPAGCPSGPLHDSRTRTWTGTPLPRGRRSSAHLASPRRARLGRDPGPPRSLPKGLRHGCPT